MKKAFFIGIAGKTMAPLAKAFLDSGWEVSGSEKEKIYPPMSTYLEENNITFVKFNKENIKKDFNLVVVGRSTLMSGEGKTEYLEAKKLGLNVCSYPEVLQKYLIKKNSIVIAGTYGKTTSSAIIAWILISAGLDPSYMVGGIPLNMKDGTRITNSEYSVVEGDETPDLNETGNPKFMFYQPKYLIITSTSFDHPEIYKTEEEYLNAYVSLVKLLPKDGFLIYDLDKVDGKVVSTFEGKKISYSENSDKADYFIKESSIEERITRIKISGKKDFSLETSFFLGHVELNILRSVALCVELGVPQKAVVESIKTFKGIKTRLEFLGEFSGRSLFWDLAQHPLKVKGSLETLRKHYPKSRIIVIFDPSATELKYKKSLEWYKNAFDDADQVIVGKVGYLRNLKGDERVAGNDIVLAISALSEPPPIRRGGEDKVSFQDSADMDDKALESLENRKPRTVSPRKLIKETQNNVFYEPIEERIKEYIELKTRTKDVIIFMSSGGLGFTDLIQETIKRLTN